MKCMRSGAPRTWSASRGKTPKPNESRESFERSSRVSFTSRSAGTSVPTGSACRSESLAGAEDRKSTRLNSSHSQISYAVFCLKKKTVLVYIHSVFHMNNDEFPLAYHITWTTYGTWLPGDDRGWVKKGSSAVQPPDPEWRQIAE